MLQIKGGRPSEPYPLCIFPKSMRKDFAHSDGVGWIQWAVGRLGMPGTVPKTYMATTRLSRILRRVDLPTGGGTPSWTSEKVAAVGTITSRRHEKNEGRGRRARTPLERLLVGRICTIIIGCQREEKKGWVGL